MLFFAGGWWPRFVTPDNTLNRRGRRLVRRTRRLFGLPLGKPVMGLLIEKDINAPLNLQLQQRRNRTSVHGHQTLHIF